LSVPQSELMVDAVRGRDHPKPNDPGYKHYIDWANRTGEFAHYKEWIHVKSVLNERRTKALLDELAA
jgi:hypothetical protein